MLRLWLIRHFPPAVPPGVCYGQTDLPLLTPLFEQSGALDRLCEQLPANMASLPVFSSPLQRCAELAAQLHPAPIIDARLQELDFGDWELQTWDAIGPTALDDWAADIAGFRPPQGETGYELQQRVLAWLHDIAINDAEMVVVTHAGVMRALQAYHQQLQAHQWLSLRYDYGQVLCLDFSTEQIRATSVQ